MHAHALGECGAGAKQQEWGLRARVGACESTPPARHTSALMASARTATASEERSDAMRWIMGRVLSEPGPPRRRMRVRSASTGSMAARGSCRARSRCWCLEQRRCHGLRWPKYAEGRGERVSTECSRTLVSDHLCPLTRERRGACPNERASLRAHKALLRWYKALLRSYKASPRPDKTGCTVAQGGSRAWKTRGYGSCDRGPCAVQGGARGPTGRVRVARDRGRAAM